MDNGTAAWGKPADTSTGWGDSDDAGNASGWGNPPNPIKSGKKVVLSADMCRCVLYIAEVVAMKTLQTKSSRLKYGMCHVY